MTMFVYDYRKKVASAAFFLCNNFVKSYLYAINLYMR